MTATAITKQTESASDVERVIDQLASPQVPEIPVLTESRIAMAILQFMSAPRSIAEAAGIRGESEVTLRERIERDPFFAEAVTIVGRRNGKVIKQTNFRLLWLAEDRASRAASSIVLGPRRRAGVKRRGRPVKELSQSGLTVSGDSNHQ